MHSNSDSDRAAGARTVRPPPHDPPPHEVPRWVKIFGIVAATAVAAFAGLHLAGGGMGHLAHDDIGAHAMPAEQ